MAQAAGGSLEKSSAVSFTSGLVEGFVKINVYKTGNGRVGPFIAV